MCCCRTASLEIYRSCSRAATAEATVVYSTCSPSGSAAGAKVFGTCTTAHCISKTLFFNVFERRRNVRKTPTPFNEESKYQSCTTPEGEVQEVMQEWVTFQAPREDVFGANTPQQKAVHLGRCCWNDRSFRHPCLPLAKIEAFKL